MQKGIGASPGIAIGKAYVFHQHLVNIRKGVIGEDVVEAEVGRLDEALEESKEQLLQIKAKVTEEMGTEQGEILQAHIMVLEDPVFIEEIKTAMRSEKITADHAVFKVSRNYIELFENLEDEYMKERAADIKDVSERLIKNILGIPITSLSEIFEEVIVISKDLTPSDTAQITKDRVLAFATDMGGRTSHSAIMARSLEIPAVVGLGNISERVSDGDLIIVDGGEGKVYINPDEDLVERYQGLKEEYLKRRQKLKELKHLPGETIDGHRVELAANIGTPEDVKSALEYGAEGIGLYRTEFLYMDRQGFPSEEEQYEAYKKVAEAMAPRPIIIRTLDIGGDKKLPYLEMPRR